MTPGTRIQTIVNPISAQFEAVRDGTVVGVLAYDRIGTLVDLRHTFVPTELRGQRIAGDLVADALDRIRASGETITASCSYVAAFIRRNPGYAGLLDPRRPGAGRDRQDTLDVFPDTIVTERLTLRPWSLDDTDDAFELYSDPRVTRWTRPFIEPATTRGAMRRQLDSWIRQSDHAAPPQGRWAIEVTVSGALVGGAHLLEHPAAGDGQLVMSWELTPSARGHGFATEAGHGLVHSAFTRDAHLEVIHAMVPLTNRAAVAALHRIGLAALPSTGHGTGTGLELFAISRADFTDREERRSRRP